MDENAPEPDRLRLARIIVDHPIVWSITVFAWCFTAVTLLDGLLLQVLDFSSRQSQVGFMIALTVGGVWMTLIPARRVVRETR